MNYEFWLSTLLAAVVSGFLFRLTYNQAYRRGYDAGQLDARLDGTGFFGRHFDRMLAKVEGFALGYQQASSEKVQKPQKNSILQNLN